MTPVIVLMKSLVSVHCIFSVTEADTHKVARLDTIVQLEQVETDECLLPPKIVFRVGYA